MKSLFKVSAVLWVIWGFVHILAGVFTMKGVLDKDVSSAFIGIADAANPDELKINYPAAAAAVVGQHGFNLLWIGLTTFICALFIWNGNKNAIYLAALTGGFADLGYFLFLDLGGYVHFVPGTLMTIFSSLAIILSIYANYRRKQVQ